MNQAIEDYLAAWIENAARDPAPEVFTGTSAAIRAPESHAVLVMADNIEHVVGPLYRANIRITVSSPTDDRAKHKTIAQGIAIVPSGSDAASKARREQILAEF